MWEWCRWIPEAKLNRIPEKGMAGQWVRGWPTALIVVLAMRYCCCWKMTLAVVRRIWETQRDEALGAALPCIAATALNESYVV
jgi:hypothetical protein